MARREAVLASCVRSTRSPRSGIEPDVEQRAGSATTSAEVIARPAPLWARLLARGSSACLQREDVQRQEDAGQRDVVEQVAQVDHAALDALEAAARRRWRAGSRPTALPAKSVTPVEPTQVEDAAQRAPSRSAPRSGCRCATRRTGRWRHRRRPAAAPPGSRRPPAPSPGCPAATTVIGRKRVSASASADQGHARPGTCPAPAAPSRPAG